MLCQPLSRPGTPGKRAWGTDLWSVERQAGGLSPKVLIGALRLRRIQAGLPAKPWSGASARLAVVIAGFVIGLSGGALAQPATQATEAEGGVQTLLDRAEQAWEKHDLDALGAIYSDEAFLAIVAPPDRREGAVVADKAGTLAGIAEMWKKNPPTSHRFTQRDIDVRGDLAWLRLTVADRWPDQPERLSRVMALAVRRGETWKMCFAMPLLSRPVVLVTKVQPGSAAESAGLKAGDVIASYAGQKIARPAELARLVESHASDPPDQKLALVARRGGDEIRCEVVPGDLGILGEDRLLPLELALLVDDDQPHPVKELVGSELAAVKVGDADRLVALFCEKGFFSAKPGRSKPADLFNRETVRTELAESLKQRGRELDLSTAHCEGLRLIVAGPLALGSGHVVAAKLGDKKTTLAYSSPLEVYVQQNDEWSVAAILPWPMEIGTKLWALAVLSPKERAELDERMRGELVGIGARVEADLKGIKIREVFPDSGASQAGLSAGEIIVAIDGQSVAGLSVDEATKPLRGPEGTIVTVDVEAADGARRTIAVTRSRIAIASVEHKMLADQIGLLRVSTFNDKTADEARQALEQLAAQKARGLVLDLRGNPGGSYTSVVKLAEFFVPRGRTMWLSRPIGGKMEPVTSNSKPVTHLPLVVLVDSKTGAGELVAAAIRTNKRGTVVGQKTAGSSLRKDLVTRPDGSSELVVRSEFYMNDEYRITGNGVEPDVVLPADTSAEDALAKAVELIKEKRRRS